MNETAPDPKSSAGAAQPEAEEAPRQNVYPEPPTYDWDFWAEYALEKGIAPELVCLGRAVKREVVQHRWSQHAAELCYDEVMERMMTKAPQMARRLYDLLLETDGLRYAWAEDGAGYTTSETIELDGNYF